MDFCIFIFIFLVVRIVFVWGVIVKIRGVFGGCCCMYLWDVDF